jgi:hypothetical protein
MMNRVSIYRLNKHFTILPGTLHVDITEAAKNEGETFNMEVVQGTKCLLLCVCSGSKDEPWCYRMCMFYLRP